MCHIVYPFVPSGLLANVHCSESLVWFKASGFWCTIIPGSSPEFLWEILFSSTLCLGDPEAIIPQDQSIHQLLQVLDGVDARVGQPKPWAVGLVGNRAVQSGPLGIPASGEGTESALLEPCLQGWFSLACGCGGEATSSLQVSSLATVSNERQGQLSQGHRRAGPTQHNPLISSRRIPKAF